HQAPLRRDLRDRGRGQGALALPRVAAAGRTDVHRPRPRPGDGSGAGSPRRRGCQRRAHRIVVRHRDRLPGRRRARRRVPPVAANRPGRPARTERKPQGLPMLRRLPLVLALSFALPTAVHAQDLLQAYEMARSGDRQLSISESNRDIAREGRVQARANLLPSVSGSGSIGRSYVAGESGDSRSRSWGLGLQQTVFDLGQVATLQAQRDLDTGAGFDLEAANDELITRTSATYFDVLVAIETLAAAVAAEEAL